MIASAVPNRDRSGVPLHEEGTDGGTTTNAAVALARLGAHVSVRALVGDDEFGSRLRLQLDRAGVNTAWLTTVESQSTNTATVIVSNDPPDRTILWDQGVCLARGDQIDVPAVFAHDVVLIDVNDASLRRFLLDLPAHTLPSTRLLGALTYLADTTVAGAFDLMMRHDVVVGDARELTLITGAANLADAISRVRGRMRGQNLRAAAVSLGSQGSLAFTLDSRWDAPAFRVPAVDTTGAGDAFAAAIAYGFACRWDWSVAIRFANAVAACATTALGAQTSLPTWDAAASLMRAASSDET